MPDEPMLSTKPASFTERFADFAKRLEQTKVTVWTVVAFIGVLAVLSGLAALVGYATHAMRH